MRLTYYTFPSRILEIWIYRVEVQVIHNSDFLLYIENLNICIIKKLHCCKFRFSPFLCLVASIKNIKQNIRENIYSVIFTKPALKFCKLN